MKKFISTSVYLIIISSMLIEFEMHCMEKAIKKDDIEAIATNSSAKKLISPDRRTLAVTFDAKTVDLWDIEARNKLVQIHLKAQLEALMFTPDSEIVALELADRTLSFWSIAAKKQLIQTEPGAKVKNICISPDSKKFFISAGKTVNVLDIATEKQLLRVHLKAKVKSIHFSYDSDVLIITYADGTLNFWGIDSQELRAQMPESVFVNPDNQVLFVNSDDKMIWAIKNKNGAMNVLSPEQIKVKCCSVCKKEKRTDGEKLFQCTRCKDAFYCSKECQIKDWPSHKKVCKKK